MGLVCLGLANLCLALVPSICWIYLVWFDLAFIVWYDWVGLVLAEQQKVLQRSSAAAS